MLQSTDGDKVNGRASRAVLPLVLVVACTATPAATLTQNLDISCRQHEPGIVACDYRVLDGGELIGAAAEYDATVIAGAIVDAPAPQAQTAILVLVDTSDPGRAATVRKNREHINTLLGLDAPHRVWGLAVFDADLEMICALPCAPAPIRAQLDNVVAKGHTTELYRNALVAIRKLAAVPARRRLLVLMSDGLAEDLAYHHADVIEAARRNEVIIAGVGYPRTVAQSIALQTLRRLSEETGGRFTQADPIAYDIPQDFFSTVLTAVDGGGELSFDLTPLIDAGVSGPVTLSLALHTNAASALVSVPVALPEPPAPIANPPVQAPVAAAPVAPPVTAIPSAAAPERIADAPWTWFWYGLPALLFSLVLAVSLTYAYLSRRRTQEQRLQDIRQQAPHAFLIAADETRERHRIDHTPWRIGRSRNNELPLNDTSVSRLHAEIRRDALGQFTVQDLDSLNGVFVNGDAVGMIHLEEGDQLEIGDVGFVFTLHDEDYSRQEPTVLVSTRTPA